MTAYRLADFLKDHPLKRVRRMMPLPWVLYDTLRIDPNECCYFMFTRISPNRAESNNPAAGFMPKSMGFVVGGLAANVQGGEDAAWVRKTVVGLNVDEKRRGEWPLEILLSEERDARIVPVDPPVVIEPMSQYRVEIRIFGERPAEAVFLRVMLVGCMLSDAA